MASDIHEADLDLFREQVQDAERLQHERILPERPKPQPLPRPRASTLPEDEIAVTLSESEVETQDYLLFVRPGIQRRVLADLQRGAIEVGLEVDLHGLHAEPARQILGEFFTECARRRIRCARIIHGKGARSADRQPVLKRKVNYWLRLHEQVLAFCSATQRDGGTGAVYVLLRNPDKRQRSA